MTSGERQSAYEIPPLVIEPLEGKLGSVATLVRSCTFTLVLLLIIKTYLIIHFYINWKRWLDVPNMFWNKSHAPRLWNTNLNQLIKSFFKSWVQGSFCWHALPVSALVFPPMKILVTRNCWLFNKEAINHQEEQLKSFVDNFEKEKSPHSLKSNSVQYAARALAPLDLHRLFLKIWQPWSCLAF